MATYDNTIIYCGQVNPTFTNSVRIYDLTGTFITNFLPTSAGGFIEAQFSTRKSDNHVFIQTSNILWEYDENLDFVQRITSFISVTFAGEVLQFTDNFLWVGGSSAPGGNIDLYKKNLTNPHATVATYTGIGSSSFVELYPVDPTETYVYFNVTNGTERNILKRYKFSDASITSLITYGTWVAGTNTGYQLVKGCIFSNGNIALLILHKTANVIDGHELVIFDSAGSILHTITLGISGLSVAGARVRASYDESKVFVSLRKGGTSQYVIQSYLLSDASIVDDFLIDMALMDGSFEPMPETVTGTIVVGKLTNPFDEDTPFTFQAGGGLEPDEFTLHSDVDVQEIEAEVGSGYSIVEDSNDEWIPSYFVSNGSPHTDITVAEGEVVDVIITNTRRNSGSGTFRMIPGSKKLNDSVPDSQTESTEKAIPNPHIVTAMIPVE